MLCASLSASAYDFEVDGIGYDISSFTELTVIATSLIDNSSESVIIPETVEFKGKTLRVTSLGEGFAENNTELSTLIIDAKIESISSKAFRNCSHLKHVEIPQAINIGNSAFENCEQLTDVAISENLLNIGSRAFFRCISLENISLPESLKVLGEASFMDCSKLNNVNISNVETINTSTFSGCSVLDYIVLSDNLNEIKSNAFQGTAFKSFVIPNSVTNIGEGILSNCLLLQSLTIGSGLSKIEYNPCQGAIGLKNLIIADASSNLEINFKGELYKHFSWCPSPVSNYYNIDIYFGGFSIFPIEYLYLGRSVNCNEADIGYWNYEYLINPFYGDKSIKKVDVGHSVESLPCRVLNISLKATYPFNYNEDFGYFENCNNLEELTFIGSPDTISKKFLKSTNISSLIIPNNCKSIGEQAFENCLNLQNITIGKGVECIGDKALNDIVSLAFINLCAIQPPSYSTGFSNQQYINTIVNIPPNSLHLYQEAEPWKSFWDLNEDENLLTEFMVDSIKYEIITSNTVAVSDFSDKYMQILDIPSIVNYNNISYTVSNLNFTGSMLPKCTDVIIPATIKILPNCIFQGWKNLVNIDLGQINSIGSKAFKGCESLGQLYIPSTCETIGDDAFNQCNNLKNIEFERTENIIIIGHNSDLNLSSSITPFPNPSDVDERRTGFRNGYYDGLFYGLPIEHLVINRDIELPKYYERAVGSSTSNYSTVYNDIIYYPPFYGLTKLKSVEIGENVSAICKNQIEAVVNAVPTTIEYTNFGQCDKIEVVVSNSPKAPVGGGFSQSVYENATLFLPNGGEESYQRDDYWKRFSQIINSPFISTESITFDSEEVVIDINESMTLSPVINPEDASIKKLKWSSSAPSIVNVSEEGIISSNSGDGEANITVTSCDGSGISASIKVIVKEGAGVSDVLVDCKLDISVKGSKLYIRGKTDTDIVSVYNVQGQLIITTNDNEIELGTKGIYIVQIGSVRRKVII